MLCLAGPLQEKQIELIAKKNSKTAPTGNSDTFTASDGTALHTHDANWTAAFGSPAAISQVTINSNQARCNAYQAVYAYYAASTSQISQVDVLPLSADISPGVIVNASATVAGYHGILITHSGGNWGKMQIYKDTGMVAQKEVSYSDTVAHTLRLVSSGSGTIHLSLSVDGTEQLTYDDSTPYAGGSPGIRLNNSNGASAANIIDNWRDY